MCNVLLGFQVRMTAGAEAHMHCRMLADMSWLSCVSRCFLASILPTRATVLRMAKASERCADGVIGACHDARTAATASQPSAPYTGST